VNLLVVRHGIAIEREDWQGDDELRPLTDDGVRKMRKAADGLHAIIDVIDIVAASPLVRAQQTAHLVAEPFGLTQVETLETLQPEADPDDLISWLADFGESDTIAIVGHEPHLSTLVTFLMTGQRRSRIELKKGAACMLRFDDTARAGDAILVWALPPAQLRALAR